MVLASFQVGVLGLSLGWSVVYVERRQTLGMLVDVAMCELWVDGRLFDGLVVGYW